MERLKFPYYDKIYRYEVKNMGKQKMSSKAASRIQSHSDKSGKNKGFKARAQSAAAKNKK